MNALSRLIALMGINKKLLMFRLCSMHFTTISDAIISMCVRVYKIVCYPICLHVYLCRFFDEIPTNLILHCPNSFAILPNCSNINFSLSSIFVESSSVFSYHISHLCRCRYTVKRNIHHALPLIVDKTSEKITEFRKVSVCVLTNNGKWR